MNKLISILFVLFFSTYVFAEKNIDQWSDSKKTYKDLIDEGFKIKAYDTNTIKSENGLTILMFITVLQKEKQVFECQEYQTLDNNMQTIDLDFICRKLVQPYKTGIDT